MRAHTCMFTHWEKLKYSFKTIVYLTTSELLYSDVFFYSILFIFKKKEG